MLAVERSSRCYSVQKELESMIMSFRYQQLTSTPKKERIRISFCNHRVTSPPRQQKDLKRAGICINESDRLPYLYSFLMRSPLKNTNENDQEIFLTNVTSYLCARYGAMNRSVSHLIIVLSLELSTLAYCIQFRGAQN